MCKTTIKSEGENLSNYRVKSAVPVPIRTLKPSRIQAKKQVCMSDAKQDKLEEKRYSACAAAARLDPS